MRTLAEVGRLSCSAGRDAEFRGPGLSSISAASVPAAPLAACNRPGHGWYRWGMTPARQPLLRTYLAADPAYQGQGLGRLLMDEAERRLLAAGCPKVNLQVRTSNEDAVAFYRHLGYGIDDVVSMGKRLVDVDEATPEQPPNSTPALRAGPKAHRTPGSGRPTSLPASSR
jgi:GNAT superfamily N-acetyltransferase